MSAVRYFQEKYYQGSLPNENAQAILELRKNYDSVASLRHAVRDFPMHRVEEVKKQAAAYKKEHKTLHGFPIDYLNECGIGELRDAQTLGVAFLYYAQSALLGDEVGLGKTVQVAGLYNVLKQQALQQEKPCYMLFLAEKSPASQLRDKLMQFTGEYIELLADGGKKTVEDYLESTKNGRVCSIVGTHALLANPEFITDCAKNPYQLLILDESAIVKNVSHLYYQACKQLFPLHERKILLNATPLELELREMYNQLSLLDKNYLPTLKEFNSQFVKTKPGMFGYVPDGYKNQDIFAEAVQLRYFARTRAELGATYEENAYQTVLVPMSPEQKKLMKQTTLHKMVSDYPTGVDRRIPFNRQTTPKLDALLSVLEKKFIKGQNQALIYCEYLDAQDAIAGVLQEKGYQVVLLNGQTKPKKARDAIINGYNNGRYDIMITNVLKGLDLKTCDISILYTINPNPQKMVQFEGRMLREFNVYGKQLILLCSMGAEKKFLEQVLKKRIETTDAFTRSGESLVRQAIEDTENRIIHEQTKF